MIAKTTARIREPLARNETLLLPFAYDGFTARIAEEAGSDAVYVSGFGTSMSKGGLLTQTEIVHPRLRSPSRAGRCLSSRVGSSSQVPPTTPTRRFPYLWAAIRRACAVGRARRAD